MAMGGGVNKFIRPTVSYVSSSQSSKSLQRGTDFFLSFISSGSALNSMTSTTELSNTSITVTSHTNWLGPSIRRITQFSPARI